jgi:hypothetical protein
VVSDDPYPDMIDERWDEIAMVFNTFRDKDQIIEFDIVEQKILSYPAVADIETLSERTRGQAMNQYLVATENLKFVIFVHDSKNKRLRSYVYDIP